MKKLVNKSLSYLYLQPAGWLILFMAFSHPLRAETITIGKGTGILWEGMPYSADMTDALQSNVLGANNGLLSITNSIWFCMDSGMLKNIGGYMALPLREKGTNNEVGVGLIPQANVGITYSYASGARHTMTGTIGLPDTVAYSSIISGNVTPPAAKSWCMNPKPGNDSNFYAGTQPRTATVSGTWVLVADGTQRATTATVPIMYFASYSANAAGDLKQPILPTTIDLRISALECTVSTQTAINFGPVRRNTTANSELAVKPVQLVTTCGQDSDRINANINVQFRAISGLYNNMPSRLSLNQGGGYITGEINNGVTGSGACTAATGVLFDNTIAKLGEISASDSSVTLTNQIIWRLCSGGTDLPVGPVDAAAELLVTFN